MHGTAVEIGGALIGLTAANLEIPPGKYIRASRVAS